VGQKTHPTGFRIGINKIQNSTWFTHYSVFSGVLKEDYQIRQCFKKEFAILFKKIGIRGITKLEIKRNVKQLELFIYVAQVNLKRKKRGAQKKLNPKNRGKVVLKQLHSKLKKIIIGTKKIKIKVLKLIVTKNANESSLIAQGLANLLENRIEFRRSIRKTQKILKKIGSKGFKIQVSGRLNGTEIARAEWFREGRVPLQTLRADISYATQRANTIYGVLGIKVWIFNKEII
jgi:small subunit ribosomal protein S3